MYQKVVTLSNIIKLLQDCFATTPHYNMASNNIGEIYTFGLTVDIYYYKHEGTFPVEIASIGF